MSQTFQPWTNVVNMWTATADHLRISVDARELERKSACPLPASGATDTPFQSQMNPDYVTWRSRRLRCDHPPPCPHLTTRDNQLSHVQYLRANRSSERREWMEITGGWVLLQSDEDRKTKQWIGETEDTHLEKESLQSRWNVILLGSTAYLLSDYCRKVRHWLGLTYKKLIFQIHFNIYFPQYKDCLNRDQINS